MTRLATVANVVAWAVGLWALFAAGAWQGLICAAAGTAALGLAIALHCVNEAQP